MALLGQQAKAVQDKTVTPAPATPAPATPASAAQGNGKAGRKPGQKAKTYDMTGISLELVSAPQTVTPEIAKKSAPARARDAVQLAMDAVVKRVHEQWILAGKPAAWGSMPKAQYTIALPAVEGFRMIVRRAADFNGVAVKFGTPVKGTTGDGRPAEIIVFSVRDRRERSK